jgi:hypothetical protein
LLFCGFLSLSVFFPKALAASAGTAGASFLDIPVGAEPASLGAAYTALADDAYAPTWNPGGLGFVDTTQVSGQHLSFLDSNHYEYLSFVHPLARKPNQGTTGIGVSAQYWGSGNIPGTDASGSPIGNYSSHYGAYNVSIGHSFNDQLSLGLTGKLINAQISDVSANAYGGDLGAMYRVRENLTLAATLMNVGTKLTFLNDGDQLPMAFHLGAMYNLTRNWQLTGEEVYDRTGLLSEHAGVQWHPLGMLALRMGYRTDTLKGLSPLAGLTTGIGLEVWGQELSYAFVPLGDLGNTQYISLLIRFGEAERLKRNLIHYSSRNYHDDMVHLQETNDKGLSWQQPDYEQLMQLLDDGQDPMAQVHQKMVTK